MYKNGNLEPDQLHYTKDNKERKEEKRKIIKLLFSVLVFKNRWYRYLQYHDVKL
jgi:hypothetical protein